MEFTHVLNNALKIQNNLEFLTFANGIGFYKNDSARSAEVYFTHNCSNVDGRGYSNKYFWRQCSALAILSDIAKFQAITMGVDLFYRRYWKNEMFKPASPEVLAACMVRTAHLINDNFHNQYLRDNSNILISGVEFNQYIHPLTKLEAKQCLPFPPEASKYFIPLCGEAVTNFIFQQ